MNIRLLLRYYLNSWHILILMVLACSVFSFLLLLKSSDKLDYSPSQRRIGLLHQQDNNRINLYGNDEHLAVLRKGLDQSNYSSEGDKSAPASHLNERKIEAKDADFYTDLNQVPRKLAIKLQKLKSLPVYEDYDKGDLYPWQRYQQHISQYHMYDPSDPVLAQSLDVLANKEIKGVIQKSGGTQLKLIFSFEDDSQAIMKPMRFSREVGTWPNHFYFNDFERHFAEIAAFHLDKVLKFYRVVPVIGRLINITRDIYDLASDEKFMKTFYVSPAGNYCFTGHCSYYCDTSHGICGSPELLEGSMALFLPFQELSPRITKRHPYRRSYHKRKKTEWERKSDYCHEKVLTKSQFYSSRRPTRLLLDLIDTAIFDFLQGNLDRHHYERFVDFGNDSLVIVLDNGRGFGKAYHDEMSCLAPLIQCCHLRYSTLRTLLTFHRGPRHISDAMRHSLAGDPLDKVNRLLSEDHLKALDRRVGLTLQKVRECTQSSGFRKVVVDDGL